MKGLVISEKSKHYKCCANCGKRRVECHIGCEDYAKEVILGAILTAEEKTEKAKQEDSYNVYERRIVRIAKRSGSSSKKTMRKNRMMHKRGG